MSSWKRPIFFVTPSEWLAKEARGSEIGSKGRVIHIPYPLDRSFWFRVDSSAFRNTHKIQEDDKIIVFGSAGGKKIN